ncbi:MAG: helix-turn-helix transcriptional regulator [Pseudomonadota bacterium]
MAKDELNILAPLCSESAVAIYTVRSVDHERFTREEIRRFKQVAPALVEAVKLHERLARRPVDPVMFHKQRQCALGTFGIASLSQRECLVARKTLLGHSAASTAHSLGITEGTVKNHRKRVYSKLGVDSLGELMNLFLDVAAFADGENDPLDLCPSAVRATRVSVRRALSRQDMARALAG